MVVTISIVVNVVHLADLLEQSVILPLGAPHKGLAKRLRIVTSRFGDPATSNNWFMLVITRTSATGQLLRPPHRATK